MRLPLPRRGFARLHRTLGLGVDHLARGVALVHRFRPEDPPVGSRPRRVLAIGELPAPGSAADAGFARELATGTHALVTSRHAAELLPERYDLSPQAIHHVPVGCDHWVRDLAQLPPGRESREPPSVPTVICLGAVRPSRRQVAVLRAVEALRAGGIEVRLRLVGHRLAGPEGSEEFEQALSSSPAADAVTWTTEPLEQDLPGLVAGAAVLVHLAEEELTAVTPLEAAALGTAVITSDLPAFREHFGTRAAAAPGVSSLLPNSAIDGAPDKLATAIAAMVEHTSDPDTVAARRALAATLTWSRHATATVAVWRTVLMKTPG